MTKNLIKQLSHVSLTSRNLNKVILFYVKTLGFTIIHRFVNQKKELYGLFLSSHRRTMLEFFLTNEN
jgi:catechol 2,3-dioxygenase-like lactoylglutathione lyase family enzyme